MMLVYDPCKKHGAAFFGGRNFVTIDHALGPKQEVVLTFSLVVPALPGRYVGRWRMCTPDLWKFGDKLKVVVKAPNPENAEKISFSLLLVCFCYSALRVVDPRDGVEVFLTTPQSTQYVESTLLTSSANTLVYGALNFGVDYAQRTAQSLQHSFLCCSFL